MQLPDEIPTRPMALIRMSGDSPIEIRIHVYMWTWTELHASG